MGQKNHPCCRTERDSRCTMVVSGFDPIPSHVACQHPNPACRSHPHTMDDATCAWFGRNLSGMKVKCVSTTTSKIPLFKCMLSYRILPYLLHLILCIMPLGNARDNRPRRRCNMIGQQDNVVVIIVRLLPMLSVRSAYASCLPVDSSLPALPRLISKSPSARSSASCYRARSGSLALMNTPSNIVRNIVMLTTIDRQRPSPPRASLPPPPLSSSSDTCSPSVRGRISVNLVQASPIA